ncbi:MAG: hypothetical protein ACRDYA_14245 [Egibacteraceae bacterium]
MERGVDPGVVEDANTECKIVSDDAPLTQARYWIGVATRQTLVNALGLLGVKEPTRCEHSRICGVPRRP